MIIVLGELKIKGKNIDKYIEAFEFINGFPIDQNGRNQSEIYFSGNRYQSNSSDNDFIRIIHFEEWVSLESYTRFLNSEDFKQILSLYELSVVKPKFRIFECDSVKGFPWIESLILQKSKVGKVNNKH